MTIQDYYLEMHGDYENAKMRLMNDRLITKFLKKFLNDATMSQLLVAVNNGDIEASFVAAHTLKGVAGNLALSELQKNVSALTEQLRSRTEAADTQLLEEVKKSYALVIDTINKIE